MSFDSLATPWVITAAVAGALFFGWVLLNLKTSRSDGELLDVHPIRRMMTFMMPDRNGAVVYFDSYIDVEELERFLADARERFQCDITHAVVATCLLGLHAPAAVKMNRFVVGRRVYRRKGQFVTFSMKRAKLDAEAKLATVKMDSRPGETFEQMCRRINEKIGIERSGKKTYTDKELSLFLSLPRPLLNWGFRFFKWLDYHNCLPASFIANDPMYTSIFVANLGSLNMAAGYHHLYEWGTCPLFVMLGKIEDRPVVREGQVVVRKQLHVRYTYDERIDDGLNARFGIEVVKTILESPYRYLGSVRGDGADAFALTDSPGTKLLPNPRGEGLIDPGLHGAPAQAAEAPAALKMA